MSNDQHDEQDEQHGGGAAWAAIFALLTLLGGLACGAILGMFGTMALGS